MHLGLLLYGSLATVSGGYLYDRQLVQTLRAAGDTVDVVSLPWRNYAQHLTDNFSAALLKQLRAARYDALLQDELNHPSLFALNHKLRGHYPLLSIVHHLRASEARPAWQNMFYRRIEQRYLASVEGFIFNSHTTRRAVEALIGPTAHAIVAHPAGDRLGPAMTETEIIARAHAPGPLRVVFLGNLIPRKNLPTVLRAVQSLPADSVELTIIGNDALDLAYTRFVRGLAAQARHIVWRGALPDAAIPEALRRAQVLVVPSHYEGFGIVYLEGFAHGLPAIASTAGAAHEIITPHETGFLIEPADSPTLADHLCALHTDRARLAHLSTNALARFRAHPTWAETTHNIRQFVLAQVSNNAQCTIHN